MPEENPQAGTPENAPEININTDKLRTSYANVCRIAQTPVEVIMDFGFNPNFFGNILAEPVLLDNRIILSHDGAKRLLAALHNAVQSYEARVASQRAGTPAS